MAAHRPRNSLLGTEQLRGLILSASARLQGQQLRGLLQLQVLHPLPGLLAGVLPIHCRHRAAVLHQILDSECCRTARHVTDGGAKDADWAVDWSPAMHPLVWLCMVLTSPLFSLPLPALGPPRPLCFHSLLSPQPLSH